MSGSKDVVMKSIEEVKGIVDLFYQQKEKEALDQFTIGLSNMMTAIDALFTYRTEHDDFVLDEAQLTNILKDAMNALQDGDMVLLADILQYDYLEYMEELVGNMD